MTSQEAIATLIQAGWREEYLFPECPPVLTNTPTDCEFCIRCGEFVHMTEYCYGQRRCLACAAAGKRQRYHAHKARVMTVQEKELPMPHPLQAGPGSHLGL